MDPRDPEELVPVNELQARLQHALDRLIDETGIVGAALITRDGIPVRSSFTKALSQVAFSLLVEGAMVSTMMGAAEVALAEVDRGPTRRVIAETDHMKMVVVGVNDELLLVTFAEAEVPLTDALAAIDAAVAAVAGQGG